MATLTAKIVADFTTVLASEISVGGTTATLSSATDDDGVALPTGRYFFTIDGANSSKEHISCDLNGTALTNIKTVSRQGTETAGVLRKHRIGASVSITDFAHILQINNLVNGTTDFNGSDPLKYDTDPTISDDKHFATKKYVDDTAIAGGAKATEAVYGLTRLSVAAVSAVAPIAVGDNDGRVPTQGENDALVGNNTSISVGTGNKFVTQTGLQNNTEKYAADAGANDTYTITLSPVPTAYTTGMVVHFKANTANTGAATLNVNSLGAKTIKKDVSVDLDTGDILANQLLTVIYDGTNFQVISPLPVKTYNANITINSSTTTTITCGFRPKLVRISAFNGNSNYGVTSSQGSYSVAQNTNRCTHITYASGGNTFGVGVDTTNCVKLVYGTGSTTVDAYINNITGTGFDIVSTVSGGTAYCSYEVIG
jgi:hypothetical protein